MCVQVYPASAQHRRGTDPSGAPRWPRGHTVAPGTGTTGLPSITGTPHYKVRALFGRVYGDVALGSTGGPHEC